MSDPHNRCTVGRLLRESPDWETRQTINVEGVFGTYELAVNVATENTQGGICARYPGA